MAHLVELSFDFDSAFCPFSWGMPKSSFSAADLDSQYGSILRQPPLSDLSSARYLHKALSAKRINVTEGVVKQWLLKYRTGDTAATGSGSDSSLFD